MQSPLMDFIRSLIPSSFDDDEAEWPAARVRKEGPLRHSITPSQGVPPGAVVVTGDSPFASPYPVQDPGNPASHAEAAAEYLEWISQPEQAGLLFRILKELKGRDLACQCPRDLPCHADILIILANEDEE